MNRITQYELDPPPWYAEEPQPKRVSFWMLPMGLAVGLIIETPVVVLGCAAGFVCGAAAGAIIAVECMR